MNPRSNGRARYREVTLYLPAWLSEAAESSHRTVNETRGMAGLGPVGWRDYLVALIEVGVRATARPPGPAPAPPEEPEGD